MNQLELEALAMSVLERRGVVSRGHYVYTSERHGAIYINKDAVSPHVIDL